MHCAEEYLKNWNLHDYFLYSKLLTLRPNLLKLLRTVIGLCVEANIVKLCASLSVCLYVISQHSTWQMCIVFFEQWSALTYSHNRHSFIMMNIMIKVTNLYLLKSTSPIHRIAKASLSCHSWLNFQLVKFTLWVQQTGDKENALITDLYIFIRMPYLLFTPYHTM